MAVGGYGEGGGREVVGIRRIRELVGEADFSLVELVAAISGPGTGGRREGDDAAKMIATGGGPVVAAEACWVHHLTSQNGKQGSIFGEWIYTYKRLFCSESKRVFEDGENSSGWAHVATSRGE